MIAAILFDYLLVFMMTWIPPVNRWHAAEEKRVAHAIVEVTHDFREALLLASLGAFEGSYRVGVRGKLGEIGPWQLRPPPVGRAVPSDLVGQAREALYRWKTLGPCGYTGEAAIGSVVSDEAPEKTCPLAKHRQDRAAIWLVTHPLEETRETAGP